jgi:hypothetical protein
MSTLSGGSAPGGHRRSGSVSGGAQAANGRRRETHGAPHGPERARRACRFTASPRGGTERIRESVPGRIAQAHGFAGVRIFRTVRAERTSPAESTANGVADRVGCGAIFESRQEGRPAGKRNPERRGLLGVLHFWRNDAGMRSLVVCARRSPSCARRTREAASR